MNILLKDIDIICADESMTVLKNGNIGIKDGVIEFVSASLEDYYDFKADKVISGKNKLVMPGMVNTHTHCSMTLFRNFADDLKLEEWLFNHVFPAEAKLQPEDVYWGAMLGIAEMIRSGTTAFADMYLYMGHVARAVADSSIRANLSISPLKFVMGKAKDEKNICYDYYKKWNNSENGRIKVYLEVHSAYLFDENDLMDAACLAKELNTGIQIHILETQEERNQTIQGYGMNSAQICNKCGIFDVPVVAAHCVHLDSLDMELLKSKGVNVAHNPTSNLKLGSGIANIPQMLERGINVALGTDGAASNNNLDMFEEMNLAALLHKGVNQNPVLVSAQEALRMATANGAAAIGFPDAGVIKKGMKADLIILDIDKPHFYPVSNLVSALVYSAKSSDIETVIIDGNIVMENRELKTIDEEQAKYKATEISRRILG